MSNKNDDVLNFSPPFSVPSLGVAVDTNGRVFLDAVDVTDDDVGLANAFVTMMRDFFKVEIKRTDLAGTNRIRVVNQSPGQVVLLVANSLETVVSYRLAGKIVIQFEVNDQGGIDGTYEMQPPGVKQ